MTTNGHSNGLVNNRTFAATNAEFRAACERAGIQPTQRQASKWRLGFGKAWENRHHQPEIDAEMLTAAAK